MAVTEAPARQARWQERLPVLPFALATGLAPFVVGMVALVLVAGDVHPAHDIAQIELRIRDVGRHEVFLGPYSRDGWYHPGPALFYLLALPYRLTAGASVGLHLGALALNGGSVVGMALLARRRGGQALMVVTLLASGLLVMSLGGDFVRDPWNPSVTVLPFGLMLFVTWAMMGGDRWALPVGAAVASFLAQTHVGYVALALPLLAWGAVWLAVTEVRAGRLRPLLQAAALGAAVFAVLWALPVGEQLTGSSGNLGAILDWFRDSEEPGHSLVDSWRIMSTQFALVPDWITGSTSTALSQEPTALYQPLAVPVLLGLTALAATYLWRRGPAEARQFLLLVAVAFALGFLAIARTTGIAYSYRLHWVQVLGMTTGIIMAWAAWLALRPSISVTDLRRVTAAALAGLLVLAAVNATYAAQAGTPQEEWSPALASLTSETLADLPDETGPVLVSGTSFGAMLYATGLTLGLERAGVDARLPGDTEAAGAHRTVRGDEVTARLVLATDEDVAVRLTDPELDLLAISGDPDTPPRPDDDPTVLAEEAFVSSDIETLKALGREHLDAPDLAVPFETSVVAVFLER